MSSPLEQVMGVEEAAALWGTTTQYVKKLCGLGQCKARKIGPVWILEKSQPNPLKRAQKDSSSSSSN